MPASEVLAKFAESHQLRFAEHVALPREGDALGHDTGQVEGSVPRQASPAVAQARGTRPSSTTPNLNRSALHSREQQNLTQRRGAGQHHHQAVDAEADAAGRRHPLLERFDEGLVVGLGLFIAAL
jgi:hypothetical protein